jgi:hypothetical protein
MATEINMSAYAVRDAAGAVDSDATVAKFSADLDTYIAERETEVEVISAAVNGVFEAHKGTNLNVPFVTNEALRALNVSAMPGAFTSLNKRVHAYITASSKGPNATFQIVKGPKGGIKRVADLTPAAK